MEVAGRNAVIASSREENLAKEKKVLKQMLPVQFDSPDFMTSFPQENTHRKNIVNCTHPRELDR